MNENEKYGDETFLGAVRAAFEAASKEKSFSGLGKKAKEILELESFTECFEIGASAIVSLGMDDDKYAFNQELSQCDIINSSYDVATGLMEMEIAQLPEMLGSLMHLERHLMMAYGVGFALKHNLSHLLNEKNDKE